MAEISAKMAEISVDPNFHISNTSQTQMKRPGTSENDLFAQHQYWGDPLTPKNVKNTYLDRAAGMYRKFENIVFSH